ncbi:MAG: YopX family protein [bacterium]|nr:YopX family protein [bacterium]
MQNHRIIKFRIWNDKTKSWLHGPHKHNSLDGVNLLGETILFGGLCEDISIKDLDDLFCLQYTGLDDKNGKNIFEGDIITFMGRWDENGKVLEPDYLPYKVAWQMGGLRAFLINRNGASSFYKHNEVVGVGHTDSKIIGNIFDNPELLNKKD